MMRIIFGGWVVITLMESSIARWPVHHLIAIHHVGHWIGIAAGWTRMRVH